MKIKKGDNIITINDAILVARHTLNILQLDQNSFDAANADCFEGITINDAIKIARDFIRDVNPYIKIEDGAKNIYYDPSLDRLVTVDNTSRTIIQGKQKADEAVSPSANAVPK